MTSQNIRGKTFAISADFYPTAALIGASPTLVSRPCKFRVVNHAQTTTEKTGKLIIVYHATMKCIHGLEYCTSLFVSCCQPCHGEIHGIDYNIFLFVSCHWPCHGEIHFVDYRTSLFVSCHQSCCSTGYDQRRKTTKEERIVQVKKGPRDAWVKRRDLCASHIQVVMNHIRLQFICVHSQAVSICLGHYSDGMMALTASPQSFSSERVFFLVTMKVFPSNVLPYTIVHGGHKA